MKNTSQDLVCRPIRILVYLTILSATNGCGTSNDELNIDVNNSVSTETFIPKGLSTRWDNLFAFTSDSIGYAATNDLRSDEYIISKTSDRGRTWERQCSARGKCIILKSYEDKVYYSCERKVDDSVFKSEIGFIYNGRCNKVLSNIKGRVYSMNMFNDSTLTYTEDPAYHKKFRDSYELSDSTYLSTDTGKTWKTLYTDLEKVTVFGYDSLNVYMTSYFVIPPAMSARWVVSDINTGSRRIYETGYVYTAFVDNGILMRDAMFYRCDDNMKPISTYYWNGNGFINNHGSYNACYFAKSGETALAYATQFPGKENREECIFYSTDSGYNWRTFAIGDGLIRHGFIQPSAAKIPTEVGLSVIFQDYSDSLRIVNVNLCH